jgi:YfiH family protein
VTTPAAVALIRVAEFSAVPGLVHGFTERTGGVSPIPRGALNFGRSVGDSPENVSENLRRWGEAAGTDPARIAFVKQVHGDGVIVRRSSDDRDRVPADAQVTGAPGLVLAVLTADCLPVLIVDPVRRAVAAVHAGWRGTISRIVARAIETLASEYGSRPSDLRVALGPGIRVESFEVGEEVAGEFRREFGDADSVVRDDLGAKPRVDLFLANRVAATDAGVPPDRVDDLGLCTVRAVDRFFSHRAEHGRTGRGMAFVGFRVVD